MSVHHTTRLEQVRTETPSPYDIYLIAFSCSSRQNYPFIPGHEIIGTVSRIGSAVTDLAVGDRVGVGAIIGSCGECKECKQGWQQHCRKPGGITLTYNGKLPDGQVTQGGYADFIRVDHKFAFKIPAALPSDFAAPLLCGGVTVYAPLSRYLTKPNLKVGVIGIGGLGHMAVKFAAALQKYKTAGGKVDVTAISQSSKKRADALKMGATSYLDMSDANAVAAATRTFDLLICTADGVNESLAAWIGLVTLDGTFLMVGVPNGPMAIHPFTLMGARCKIDSSGIGSIAEIHEMLAFAAEHVDECKPIIEKLPMEKANEGLKKVRDGSVRFRVVLENPQQKK